MESTNQIQIEGYIENDPTISSAKGYQTAFTLLTYVRNRSTQKDEREHWKVRSFISSSFTEHLRKGDSVVIVGRIRNRRTSDGCDTFIQADKIFKKASVKRPRIGYRNWEEK